MQRKTNKQKFCRTETDTHIQTDRNKAEDGIPHIMRAPVLKSCTFSLKRDERKTDTQTDVRNTHKQTVTETDMGRQKTEVQSNKHEDRDTHRQTYRVVSI